jgi:hypothetical protein
MSHPMPATSIATATAAAGSILVALLAPRALAQAPPAPFVARTTVTVENSSPLPQIVVGTNVPPFELLPYRRAELAMSAPLLRAPVPGAAIPVRFAYSIGQAPGPQCRGTVDLSFAVHGTFADNDEATHCVAHSFGTGGASCSIAVSARDSACEGGLAFVAP